MTDNLTGIRARLDALEAITGGYSVDDRRLDKKKLAERWDVTPRTIDRKRQEPDFPQPEIDGRRCKWWFSEILDYERRQAATPKSKPAQH